MTLQEVEQALVNVVKKGSPFIWINYETSQKRIMTAAAVKEGHTIIKKAHVQVRTNFTYENCKAVKALRAAGIARADENWWTHYHDEVLGDNTIGISKTSPTMYLICWYLSTANGINKGDIKWFIDGQQASLQDVIDSGYLRPSGVKTLTAKEEDNSENKKPPFFLLDLVNLKGIEAGKLTNDITEAFSDDANFEEDDPFSWEEDEDMPSPTGEDTISLADPDDDGNIDLNDYDDEFTALI